jgi:hypothetical protein
MKALSRHRGALFALLCLAAGVLLVLLASDVRTWNATVARDDLRFRALPDHRALWRPATILPADPASHLLGTSSTVAYRRALQSFWYSRIGSNPETRQDLPTIRATAQERLQEEMLGGPDAVERSTAANLLGVLVVTTPAAASDQDAIAQLLRRAAQYFRTAIAEDQSNTDAKENLELVLRLQRPGKGKIGRDARSGYGFGRGRGAGNRGTGY